MDGNPDVIPGSYSQERADWYDTTLDEIVGRQKEPAPGGSETWFLIKELRPAYVMGLFHSTIFLCAAATEQILVSEADVRGLFDGDPPRYFGDAIDVLESEDLLSSDEAHRARQLKERRINTFHWRPIEAPDSPTGEYLREHGPEAFLEGEGPWTRYHADVRDAIRLVLELGTRFEYGTFSG